VFFNWPSSGSALPRGQQINDQQGCAPGADWVSTEYSGPEASFLRFARPPENCNRAACSDIADRLKARKRGTGESDLAAKAEAFDIESILPPRRRSQ
jgi:hypothetical protein